MYDKMVISKNDTCGFTVNLDALCLYEIFSRGKNFVSDSCWYFHGYKK